MRRKRIKRKEIKFKSKKEEKKIMLNAEVAANERKEEVSSMALYFQFLFKNLNLI